MNTFTQKVKLLTAIAALMGATAIKAQLGLAVNYGTNYQCLNGNNIVNAQVTNSITGTTGYLWTVTSPTTCIATYTATGGGDQVNISASCVGQYTVCCSALSGSTALASQCSVFNIYPNPTVNISSSSSSSVPLCAGSGYTLTGSGAMTYTWMPFFSGATYVAYPTSSTCYTLVGADANGCTSSAVSCVSVMPSPVVSIAGNATVCLGTSTCFTASGASSYAWSNGISGSTMCILPLIGNSYSVAGTGSNGCTGMAVVNVVVDTTCANVWPGDANSDGVVSSTDVLEIGLAYGSTGAPRTPGGNAYTSQYATAWSGYVSTWKNKCHADCNGDGTIDLNDTLAIYNNFSLTHSFKSSEASSAGGDINFDNPSGGFVAEGMWNKVDIMLGSSASAMSQLYGVTFDINFDNALIQANSAYIVYSSSFLNASNQNVQFKKLDFTNGKIYAASVRTNGSNVNGFGKIGEFWFKVKTGATGGLNLSVSNVSSINKNGVKTTLAGSSSAFGVVTVTGVKEQGAFEHAVRFFPNPAKNQLTLQSGAGDVVNYTICDISGREIVNGEFTDSKTIDISALSAGSYIVKFQSGTLSSHKKVIIEK